MDGDVKVLLVSAGASPDALIAELVRLGVTIVECAFADAEEHLETDPPDLVALSGALGAVELANMIDDLEDGPRMVIVAERKELAKLRGLNREVVVSLFAMETTEKVVGQRIESLARRAARRRQQKAGPEPSSPKRTSLGLPQAVSPVGRVELKKPPLVEIAERDKALSLIPGNHPGLEPIAAPPREETPARDQDVPPSERPLAPPRATEQKTKSEVAYESIPVMDEDLLESIRPGEGDSEPVLVPVPASGAVPLSDIEVLSQPPTLPPAAKAQKREPLPSFGTSRGDLDLSAVEDALESLEGATNEITPDLVDHAHKEMGQGEQPHLFQDNEDTVVVDKPNEAALLLSSEVDLPAAEEIAKPEPAEARLPEQPPAADPPGATALVARSDEIEPPTNTMAATLSEQSPPEDESLEHFSPGGPPRAKKSSGAGWFLVAVVSLGAAALAYKAGVLESKPSTPDRSSAANDKSPSQSALERENKRDASRERAPAPPDTAAVSDTNPGAESDKDGAATPDEAGDPVKRSSALSNPYQRPDTKKPSCEAVLQGNTPLAGKDPVHEASLVWQEARAKIVGGKKDEAHVLMCQAVTLNPESAAIEGLAQHYLSEGAYSEARKWAEKAETIRPGQREMNNLRGDIYGMMGESEKAREVWLSTLHIRPEEKSRIAPVSKDYSVEAGRHLRRGDLVRAEQFFRRAIILDGENVSGMIGLAKVYQRMNEPEYARAFSEMALRVSDLIPEVHVLLGELALQEGNRAAARTHFERALAVRPDFFPAKRGLSQVKQ